MLEYFTGLIDGELIYLLRTVFAGVCGLMIGMERSRRQKEAGIRTHLIVACAASLFTCISLSFSDGADAARIAAQIIPGISFLGAGVIFFRRESIHGLTTAAGIWATAAIGMSMGRGLYVLAFCGTLLIMGIQFVFHTSVFKRKNYQQIFSVKFHYNEQTRTYLQDYFKVKEFSRFKVFQQNNALYAEAVIRPQAMYTATEIASLVQDYDEIQSIERLEDL